jgi:hypothetical protein
MTKVNGQRNSRSREPLETAMRRTWLHRYTVLLSTVTLAQILIGAFVTTNPERPLYSLGELHRVLGVAVNVLTIGLTLWLTRMDDGARLRRLGWIAAGAVVTLTVLGLPEDPLPAMRLSHAFLAQLFFGITVVQVVVTASQWNSNVEVLEDASHLRWLATLAPIFIGAQVALGTAFRHGFMEVMPHLMGAVVVVFFILVPCMLVIYRPEYSSIRGAGRALLTLTVVQLLLGFALQTMRSLDVEPTVVIVTSALHAATAALTLGGSVVFALVVRRKVRVSLCGLQAEPR